MVSKEGWSLEEYLPSLSSFESVGIRSRSTAEPSCASENPSPSVRRSEATMAEREGFEPSVPVAQYNGLASRPVRPLRHLSEPWNVSAPGSSTSTERESRKRTTAVGRLR